MTQKPGAGGDDSQVSEETLMSVARVRERAAHSPSSAELAGLLTTAATSRKDMTPDEISDLAAAALRQARQVSYLLGRLAGLLGDEPEERHGQ